MPIYRLLRVSDNKTFDDKDARDDKHALILFEQELGVVLTFTERPTAPQYLMGRMDTTQGGTKPPNISVYEVRQNSN